ncbi:UNVERIFIED_ORG: hypothetical protein J2W38_007084 [Variovorax paradoxus]|nr:hypothetical protein [Variovorax paradoxus]
MAIIGVPPKNFGIAVMLDLTVAGFFGSPTRY